MAASKVLATIELLELVLGSVPSPDLLLAANTNSQWRATIGRSCTLRNRLVTASNEHNCGSHCHSHDFHDPSCRSCCGLHAHFPAISIGDIKATTLAVCQTSWGRMLVRRVRGKDYFAALSIDSRSNKTTLRFSNSRVRITVISQSGCSWTMASQDKGAGKWKYAYVPYGEKEAQATVMLAPGYDTRSGMRSS
jgi:hypothetical protein